MCLEVAFLKVLKLPVLIINLENASQTCQSDRRVFPNITLACVRLTKANQHTYFPFKDLFLLIMCVHVLCMYL